MSFHQRLRIPAIGFQPKDFYVFVAIVLHAAVAFRERCNSQQMFVKICRGRNFELSVFQTRQLYAFAYFF